MNKKKIVLDKGYRPNDLKISNFGIVEIYKRKKNVDHAFLYTEECINNKYVLKEISLGNIPSWQNFYITDTHFSDCIEVQNVPCSKRISSKEINKYLDKNRDDSIFVSVVEEYGRKCNVNDTRLKVVEIPNIEYEILKDYEGKEIAVKIEVLG